MPDSPIGVVYNTSMSRPDAALALAAMYLMERRNESRMGSVCVVGAGLATAVFCDMIARMYFPAVRDGNQALAIGLADDGSPDPPMVQASVAHHYPTTIHSVSDTSAPEAVLRNGVIFNAESVVILSAPATYLAKTLDLAGAKDLYTDRVKRLIVVEAGTSYNDPAALRRIVAEWPAPVVFCPKEVGEALRFPGVTFETTPASPVVDAYEAYQPMPYDAPLHDLAAAHYAIHPDSGFFELNAKTINIVPGKKPQLLAALIAMASAQPGR